MIERESSKLRRELLADAIFVVATALGGVFGIILSVAYGDRIDAACTAVVRWIWL